MEKEKIILDVDTGSDDAVAIVCALLSDETEVLGITTVTGNVEIRNTTDNTLRVVECCGKQKEVKVYRGAALPLASTLVPWGIQGKTLPRKEKDSDQSLKVHPDHLPLPETSLKEEDKRAVSWIIETLLDMPDRSVTLVPVGPQTNIALAIRSDERILNKIKRVVMMGGSHDKYAPTQGAEFNVWTDPEAAEIVLSSGLDVTMVSLDATSTVSLGHDEVKAIRGLDTRPANLVADMIEQRLAASSKTMKGAQGAVVGVALHDPLAVCAISHPEVLTDVWETSCHVDLGRGFAYGETILGRNYETVYDENGEILSLPKNVRYARKADRDFFYKWLYGILKKDKEKQR
ncbi:MAG: nucleoside hydrolase [Erysipelotrichaceae bacterium]|nr:nucleoside hydrolase [Erysipelotrichaceae bacterium]